MDRIRFLRPNPWCFPIQFYWKFKLDLHNDWGNFIRWVSRGWGLWLSLFITIAIFIGMVQLLSSGVPSDPNLPFFNTLGNLIGHNNSILVYAFLLGVWNNIWGIIGIFFILAIAVMAIISRRRILIDDFEEIRVDDISVTSTSGNPKDAKTPKEGGDSSQNSAVSKNCINSLLLSKLLEIDTANESIERKTTNLLAPPQDSPMSIGLSSRDVTQDLAKNIGTQNSTIKLGFIDIPVSAIVTLFGTFSRGPHISGSLFRIDGRLILTAELTGERASSWHVERPSSLCEKEEIRCSNGNISDKNNILEEMIEELAYKIFVHLVYDDQVQWPAAKNFVMGMERYHETTFKPADLVNNSKEAMKLFRKAIREDGTLQYAYYNIAVILHKLAENGMEKQTTVESAFNMALAMNTACYEAYYGLALSIYNEVEWRKDLEKMDIAIEERTVHEKHDYSDVINLCDRIINAGSQEIKYREERKFGLMVKAYNLKGKALLHLMLDEDNCCADENLWKAERDRVILNLDMAIYYSWKLLFFASKQGYNLNRAKKYVSDSYTSLADTYVQLYEYRKERMVGKNVNDDELRSALTRYERALAIWRTNKKPNSSYLPDPEIVFKQGRVHLLLGNFEEASQLFFQAIQIAPKKGDYWGHLAAALAQTIRRSDKKSITATMHKYGDVLNSCVNFLFYASNVEIQHSRSKKTLSTLESTGLACPINTMNPQPDIFKQIEDTLKDAFKLSYSDFPNDEKNEIVGKIKGKIPEHKDSTSDPIRNWLEGQKLIQLGIYYMSSGNDSDRSKALEYFTRANEYADYIPYDLAEKSIHSRIAWAEGPDKFDEEGKKKAFSDAQLGYHESPFNITAANFLSRSVFYYKNDYLNAYNLIEEAIINKPTNPNFHYNAGCIIMTLANELEDGTRFLDLMSKSIEQFQLAIELYESKNNMFDACDARHILGHSYLIMGKLFEAKTEFRIINAQMKDWLFPGVDLSIVLLKCGRLEECETQLDETIRLVQEKLNIYSNDFNKRWPENMSIGYSLGHTLAAALNCKVRLAIEKGVIPDDLMDIQCKISQIMDARIDDKMGNYIKSEYNYNVGLLSINDYFDNKLITSLDAAIFYYKQAISIEDKTEYYYSLALAYELMIKEKSDKADLIKLQLNDCCEHVKKKDMIKEFTHKVDELLARIKGANVDGINPGSPKPVAEKAEEKGEKSAK